MSGWRVALLAIGLAASGVGVAGAAPAAPTSAQPPAWSVPGDPAKDNWRAQTMLDKQRKAGGGAAPMRGWEQESILDNYQKSIGKGGAGPPLPHVDPNENNTTR